MSEFNIQPYLPKHLRKLLQGKNEDSPYFGEETGFLCLDRNENRLGSIGHEQDHSRFPDPKMRKLRQRLASYQEIDPNALLFGSHVDLLFDLLLRSLCCPSQDRIAVFQPCEPCFAQRAQLHQVAVNQYELNSFYQLPASRPFLNEGDEPVKLLVIQNPNPITGIGLRIYDLIDLLDTFEGFVVVDERGIEWSDESRSLVPQLAQYPRLIILNDFSEAWGLASAQIAVLYAHPSLIEVLDKLNYAYPLNRHAQQVLSKALRLPEELGRRVAEYRELREELREELLKLSFVREIWASERNFLLLRVERPQLTLDYLRSEGIVVRLVSNVGEEQLEHCLRMSVGNHEDNSILLRALQAMPYRTSRTRKILKTLSSGLQKAGLLLGIVKKFFT